MSASEFIAAMDVLGLGLADAGRLLHITPQTISNYRSRKQRVSGPVALAIRMLLKHPHELQHWLMVQCKE